MQYLSSFFTTVKQYRFQDVNKVPHIGATHLTVHLFDQDVDGHDGIQNIYKLGEKEVKGETNVRNSEYLAQKVLTIQQYNRNKFHTFGLGTNLLEKLFSKNHQARYFPQYLMFLFVKYRHQQYFHSYYWKSRMQGFQG